MDVVRVLAPNPGFFTGPGTNTYLIGSDEEVVVIDPGPVIDDHRQAILRAIGDRTVACVAVTHTHPDHAPLANPLAAQLGTPAVGYGPGPAFTPDRRLADLATIEVGGTRLTAIHTPGHSADHLCYVIDQVLFSGDHIMGGSTVVIDDAAAYLTSLERLANMRFRLCHPGHGPDISDPAATIAEYIEHRKMREGQIIDAIAAGATQVDAIVEAVYSEVPQRWRFSAVAQVRTQLTKLIDEGRVRWATAEGEAGGARLAEDR